MFSHKLLLKLRSQNKDKFIQCCQGKLLDCSLFARCVGDYSVVSVAIRCKFCVKGNRFTGNGGVQNWEIQPNLMPQGLLNILPFFEKQVIFGLFF